MSTEPPKVRDKFLDVNVETSRQSLAAIDTSQLLYSLVDIRPTNPERVRQMPLNLSLVIDRSTSMRGRRLANVRAAAAMIVEKLRPEDNLSVIAYSDRATTIISNGKRQDKAQVLRKIQQIEAFGGTEAFQGLRASYREIRRLPLDDLTNQVILLTDGHTYGDADKCLDLVREGAQDGINLSAFGIGPEWNEDFLDQLAAISGGETAYIAAPGQLVQALQQCLRALSSVYAHNVRLARNFASAFNLVSAFRVSPTAQPLGANGHNIRLGNVDGNMPLSFLLEFTVKPQAAGTIIPLVIDLTADLPTESVRDHHIQLRRELAVVTDAPEDEPSEKLVAAVQAWNFHQMNNNVWEDIERGDVHKAQTRMQQLTRRLMDAGHTKVAQRLRAETERIAAGDGVSSDGRKALTFATRSLVTQTVRLSDD